MKAETALKSEIEKKCHDLGIQHGWIRPSRKMAEPT